MKIINATKHDANDIVSINTQLYKPFIKPKTKRLASKHLNVLLSRYINRIWILDEIKAGNQYIIKNKSKIFGAMCFFTEADDLDENESFIETLVIKSDEHNKGLGRKLVEFAKEKSYDKCKSFLTVYSFCDLKVKDFYIKCGFKFNPKLGNFYGFKYYKFSMELKV